MRVIFSDWDNNIGRAGFVVDMDYAPRAGDEFTIAADMIPEALLKGVEHSGEKASRGESMAICAVRFVNHHIDGEHCVEVGIEIDYLEKKCLVWNPSGRGGEARA